MDREAQALNLAGGERIARERIIAVQQDIGIPDSWNPLKQFQTDLPKTGSHFLLGSSFCAELKGRIAIEADEAGWIAIHTEAGPIMIRKQVLSIDGGEL